MRVPEHLIVD